MDFTEQFIKDCLKTESNDFEKIKERLTPDVVRSLKHAIDEFIYVSNSLDLFKKYLFYGKLPQNNKDFFKDYVEWNYGTFNYSGDADNFTDRNIRLIHAGLGFATESSEYLEQMLKHLHERTELDVVNLTEEIFDKTWYDSIALDALGENTFRNGMEKIAAKLKARYGEKFSDSAAINRDLETERKVMES